MKFDCLGPYISTPPKRVPERGQNLRLSKVLPIGIKSASKLTVEQHLNIRLMQLRNELINTGNRVQVQGKAQQTSSLLNGARTTGEACRSSTQDSVGKYEVTVGVLAHCGAFRRPGNRGGSTTAASPCSGSGGTSGIFNTLNQSFLFSNIVGVPPPAPLQPVSAPAPGDAAPTAARRSGPGRHSPPAGRQWPAHPGGPAGTASRTAVQIRRWRH